MANSLVLATEIAKPFERLSLVPYHDPVGFPTIGWGHLLSRVRWADLSRWSSITEARAEELIQEDMLEAVNAVRRLITQSLLPAQEAAIIDFAFNCGAGNLQVSTLRRVINRGELSAAPEQFRRWVYAASVRLPGLVRRREAEVDMWLSV